MSKTIKSKNPKTVNFLGLQLIVLGGGTLYLKFLQPLMLT